MDSIVTSVVEQFKARSKMGEQKYGVNMDREDLQFPEWITHMKEELMDAILYLEKLEKIYNNENNI
ncbi:hypothetical protein [uncultured virus]|jgi:hypothetical protein|uniref:Uncharacterized protein n=1 Tax=uncultured virus TaxID=340016 RepID=A0A218MM95_9VIRU|nr:hypothetical protein [uncultured virus]